MSQYFLPVAIANNIKIEIKEVDKHNVFLTPYLSNQLIYNKTKIEKFINKWEYMKKITNPYEYIHTNIPNTKNALCMYKPLSRSYFKMIEMINVSNLFSGTDYIMGINSFHLAEGPGGFIEAIANTRKNINDKYYGMTLIDNKQYVPGWKKITKILDKYPNIIIEKGQDNTGDLLNIENFTYCYSKYKNSMHIITADGGFDFSINYNMQEVISLELLFAQIAYAIILQKKGGTFIIKIFDVFSSAMVDLIYLLTSVYSEISFYKPYTSRPANSEKYLICKKFRLEDSSLMMPQLLNIFNFFKQKKNNNKILGTDYFIDRFIHNNIPLIFRYKLEEININLGQQQLETIDNTLRLIKCPASADRISTITKSNIEKCVKWCKANNQPFVKKYSNHNIFL